MTSRLAFDERLRTVETAIEQLTGDHQEVIILRYYLELGFGEIGERMGRSADAARMLLARAMTTLTAALEGVDEA
jgi:RNA polymerase sigma factor (sigma-70 family)